MNNMKRSATITIQLDLTHSPYGDAFWKQYFTSWAYDHHNLKPTLEVNIVKKDRKLEDPLENIEEGWTL